MNKEQRIEKLKEENRQRRIEAYQCAHPLSHLHVILWEEIRWHDRYIRWVEENLKK
jgi:hypothetical protein